MREMPNSFQREFHRDAAALWRLWLELDERFGPIDRVVVDTLALTRREIVPGWPRRRYVSALNQLVECGWLTLWQPKGGGYGDDHKRWTVIDREARSKVSLVGMTMTPEVIAERRAHEATTSLSAMRNGRSAPPKRKSEHAKSAAAFLNWRRQQLELFPLQPEPPPSANETVKNVVPLAPKRRPEITGDYSRSLQRELAFA